ncbi:MAG: hypothetical protein WA268_14230 [Xanthobacteraceae bacterium]
MIYIALILIIAILVLRAYSPKRYAVHAATAVPLPKGIRPVGRWLMAGFLRDANGKLMDVDDKFIGTAIRDSMAPLGIPDGATFVADYVHPPDDRLNPGDIVVVDGVHANSQIGLRLRRIAGVHDDIVDFMPDGLNRPHRSRPAKEVVARVTHVVTSGTKGAMPLKSLLEHLPSVASH